MDTEHFAFAFDPTYRRLNRPFGVTPESAWVEVGGGLLKARFGPWRVTTPLANVSGAEVTGPYAFLKTAGPARLAITDRGLTFATNGDRGVRIDFATPVRGLDPLGLLRHPELTVTVTDVEGLAALLTQRIGRLRVRYPGGLAPWVTRVQTRGPGHLATGSARCVPVPRRRPTARACPRPGPAGLARRRARRRPSGRTACPSWTRARR